MKNFLKKNIFLIAIVLIAAALRLYQLGMVPISPNWDEVALGYNASSILKTGKDEYGDFLPVVLRSYDDYKPAFYVYATIPSIALFGISTFAVRLPSALFGVLAVFITYLLISELINKKTISVLGRTVDSKIIALLTSFLLAISPWHIQFSRVAFEANVGLTINLLVFYLFLKGLKKPLLLVASFALGALNLHVYQSDRVFTPLLLITLTLLFSKQLLRIKKWFIVSVATAFIIVLPLLFYIATNQNALERARGVSIFSDQNLTRSASFRLMRDVALGDKLGLLIDNRRVEFVKATVDGYISHFDFVWLFINGDIERHHAPSMGLLYLFEIPFLLLGIYLFIFTPFEIKRKIAFLAYFLLVPVPASITSGVPHAVRTLNFLPTWQLFIAFGIVGACVYLFKIFKSESKLRYIAMFVGAFYSVVMLINFSYFLNQYFVQQNYYHAREWIYGYKEVIDVVRPIQKNYEKIVVSNLAPLDQSYMFFLFYLKIDPKYYLANGGTDTGGFREQHQGFENFIFEPISEGKKLNKKTLFVAGPNDDLNGLSIIHTVYYPNGEKAIVIAEKN